jgi:hypothetical protein
MRKPAGCRTALGTDLFALSFSLNLIYMAEAKFAGTLSLIGRRVMQ